MLDIELLKKNGVNIAKDDGIDCSGDEVLTQQSAAKECDINYIIERAKRGADLSSIMSDREPQYGDFTQVPKDLRECLLIVKKADEAFMSLDAHVRKRFDNDPAKMLDFLNDEKNREEAISLGLVAPKVAPKVDPVVEAIKGLPDAIAASSAKKAKAKPADE